MGVNGVGVEMKSLMFRLTRDCLCLLPINAHLPRAVQLEKSKVGLSQVGLKSGQHVQAYDS